MRTKKRGQITIFFILGMVLVALTLIIILTGNKDTIIEEPTHSRIQNHIFSCSEIIVEDYIARALITAGYGDYPTNIIRNENNLHVLSYDISGVYYGIFNKNIANKFLENELKNLITCVEPALDEDYEIYGERTIIKKIKHEVQIKEQTILVSYEYEYDYQGINYKRTLNKSYNTNLGYFLQRTNYLTDKITQETQIDTLLNHQFCEQISQERKKPNYAVDFLTKIDTTNKKFIFDETFFIIILEKEEETFSFAIRPTQTEPFC